MKGGRTASGYTIVEVMIFLAVSGMLFVLAMLTINGQQARANFTQGTRDFQAAVDDVINDIRNGFFPDPGTNYTCTVSGDNAPTFSGAMSPGDTGDKGTHDKCTFIGKVMQFTLDESKVTVHTVVGRRIGAKSGGDPQDFHDARPVIPNEVSAPSFTEEFNIPGGLVVTAIQAKKGAGDDYSVRAVGFFSAFTNSSNPDKPLNNALVQVVPIRPLGGLQTAPEIINGAYNPGSWAADYAKDDSFPDAVVICLRQGSGGKIAALIIGDNKSRSATALYVDDAQDAADRAMGGDGSGSEFVCPA